MQLDTDIISVLTLAPVYSTRERGNEAYKNLAPHLTRKLLLDLDGPQVITPSFIDSIILRLKEHNQTNLVSFRATDQSTIDALKRICNLRDTKLAEHKDSFSLA